MSHTPAFRELKQALDVASVLVKERISLEQLEDYGQSCRISRRTFLKGGASVSVFGLIKASGGEVVAAPVVSQPTIAIIGGGVAGTHCAYRLQLEGVRSELFEASSRIGGRMFSARDKFASGQVAELGGEFIDKEHYNLRSLAKELNVELDNIRGQDYLIDGRHFFVDGRWISNQEMIEAAKPITRRAIEDLEEAEKNPTAYTRLDRMNIVEWLDTVPDLAPFLRTITEVTLSTDSGLEAEEQSALNFLNSIDPKRFSLYHEGNERFRVHKGNQTIPSELASKLPKGAVHTEMRLLRIAQPHRSYELTFEENGKVSTRRFDLVVLALPFTMLRRVEMKFPIDKSKRWIIDNLGYGTNAKIMGGFSERVWRTVYKDDGEVFSDNGLQEAWETSRSQSGREGIMTNFLGGKIGMKSGEGTPDERYSTSLDALDQLWPGTKATYLKNTALRMHWPSAPYHMGSYSCQRPGQYFYKGEEKRRIGNIFFCGEHTSLTHSSYMEGGCKSGAEVAQEILNSMKLIERAKRIPVLR